MCIRDRFSSGSVFTIESSNSNRSNVVSTPSNNSEISLNFLIYWSLKEESLNSICFARKDTPGTSTPSSILGPNGGSLNSIVVPLTVYATPGSCKIPSKVTIRDSSL